MTLDTTRKDFGTAIATIARLYREAKQSGDARRAEIFAAAVDVLLDAWPADPEVARPPAVLTSERRLRADAQSQEEGLTGLGTPDRLHIDPVAPMSWHRGGERASRRRG
jgi:hypothetical protein